MASSYLGGAPREHIADWSNANVVLEDDEDFRFKHFFPQLDLTGRILKIGEHPQWTNGAFADVFLGSYEGREVAIKALRAPLLSASESKVIKRLYRECKTWSQADHKNVLRLIGYALGISKFAALISPWQANGTAITYLTDKDDRSRLQVITGAAEGLEYLHNECQVVHGDFRGTNILISKEGVPLVADFGLSRIISHSASMHTSTGPGGNPAWMAIELLDGTEEEVTRESDVWAFGMTALELMLCQVPFYPFKAGRIVMELMNGKRPPVPNTFNAELKTICERSWAAEPKARPPMSTNVGELHKILEGLYGG